MLYISLTVALVPLILGGFQTPHQGYPNGYQLSSRVQLADCLVDNFDEDHGNYVGTVYCVSWLNMTASCGFDFEANGYYVTDFVFTLTTSVVLLYDGETSLCDQMTLTYSPEWEYTQNTSWTQFNECSVRVTLDAPNNECYIYFLQGANYVRYTYVAIMELSGVNSCQMTASLDSSNLERVLDQFVNNGESSYDDYQNAYDTGYNTGYADGQLFATEHGQPSVIFTGILNVALLPVNMFLQILNFEVFGINISGLVTGFLTIAIILILVRTIFNGGNKGD